MLSHKETEGSDTLCWADGPKSVTRSPHTHRNHLWESVKCPAQCGRNMRLVFRLWVRSADAFTLLSVSCSFTICMSEAVSFVKGTVVTALVYVAWAWLFKVTVPTLLLWAQWSECMGCVPDVMATRYCVPRCFVGVFRNYGCSFSLIRRMFRGDLNLISFARVWIQLLYIHYLKINLIVLQPATDKMYILYHICSTRSPLLPCLSRHTQSGRWSSFGKRVWFTESHIVLVICFCLFTSFILDTKKMRVV